MKSENTCPFCECNVVAVIKTGPHIGRGVQVECDNCGARGPVYDRKADAIEGWNKGIRTGFGRPRENQDRETTLARFLERQEVQ